ncbi:MAG: radical SAM protein [Candidatus Omnitrophica bacterium]|nr:radical SAM protein [Candidatus Omnitrophota bacterium]MDD5552716.1 radical SAM protein [Candidatus Omnitrophota bacterium]
MQYKSDSFLRSESRSAQTRRPAFCCIEISSVCLLKCKMCFAWKLRGANSGRQPTLNEWKDFISLLAELSEDSIEINFSGAEPLSDSRNLDLIAFCSDRGLCTSLNTSGFLIDADKARRISRSGLNSITISLDSMNRSTHDFLRGTEGCYDKVMQGIDHLDKHCGGLTIGIQTVILENNLDEIIGLTEWAEARKRIDHICFQALAQTFFTPPVNGWHKKKEYNTLWPKNITRVHRVIDELIRLKHSGYKIANTFCQLEIFKTYFDNPGRFIRKSACNVDFYMTVDQFGDVRTCGMMPVIGNIKTDLPKDIWYSKTADRMREKIRKCKANCHILINCGYEAEDSLASECAG